MKNDFSKPVLKVGQLWRNGYGKEVRIVRRNSDPEFPFDSDDKFTYTPYGSWWPTRNNRDLVELIEDERGNPVSAIPNPENYKRIDHEDGRIEFVPIKKEKQEEYFDFGDEFKFNIELSNPPLAISDGWASERFKHKELLLSKDYELEVVEEDGYTRLRFKKK
jgi:hypothetical protein